MIKDPYRTKERAKPVDLTNRKRRWRPERNEHEWLYQYLDATLALNHRKIKFSKLVDLALLGLFAPYDDDLARQFANESNKFELRFPDGINEVKALTE
jgi:hypothetical protein